MKVSTEIDSDIKNLLPKRLEAMTCHPQLPFGNEMFALLRQWFPFAPVPIRGSSCSREMGFLKWLIEGRVVRVLLHLEASQIAVDRRIAALLRQYGRKTCPRGPYPAQPITRQLFGWIGIEMGNPTWGSHPHKAFIELPTARMLETYARMLGGRLERMEFFPGGVYVVENLTDVQMEAISAIKREHGLRGRWLHGDGVIIYMPGRPTEDQPQEPAGPYAAEFVRMREESRAIFNECMIAAGADFTVRSLESDIRQKILNEISREDASQNKV